jgi:hypothetical protein
VSAVNVTALSNAIRDVLTDYFPDPESLFITEDEERGRTELAVDLVEAVLNALAP